MLELIPGTMEHKDKRLRELEANLEISRRKLERNSINNVIPECPVSSQNKDNTIKILSFLLVRFVWKLSRRMSTSSTVPTVTLLAVTANRK